MEFIFFIGGVFVGICSSMIFKTSKYATKGIIDIDHDNNFYSLRFISKDVVDNRKNKAMFLLNHDATISREEQIL